MSRQEGYVRWPSTADVPLILTIADRGQGVGGQTPQIAIRRYKESHAGLLDNYYWNTDLSNPSFGGVGDFDPAEFWHTMVPIDVARPGHYTYMFEQTAIGLEWVYHVYYRNTGAPAGIALETHMVTNEVYIPTINPDPVLVGPTTIMGQLELVKGLLHHNSIVDNQTYENGQLTSARVRVFSVPTQIPDIPGGSETAGMLAEFQLESSYDVDGMNQRFALKRVFP